MTQNELNAALFDAVRKSDLKKATDLLAQGADKMAHDANDDDILFVAIRRVKCEMDAAAEMVLLLVDAGCPLNALQQNGSTPVINALMVGNTALAEALLERKADLDIKSRENEGAFISVMNYGVAAYKETAIGFLIENGADLSAKNAKGYTALEMAERQGDSYKEIADILRAAPAIQEAHKLKSIVKTATKSICPVRPLKFRVR